MSNEENKNKKNLEFHLVVGLALQNFLLCLTVPIVYNVLNGFYGVLTSVTYCAFMSNLCQKKTPKLYFLLQSGYYLKTYFYISRVPSLYILFAELCNPMLPKRHLQVYWFHSIPSLFRKRAALIRHYLFLRQEQVFRQHIVLPV